MRKKYYSERKNGKRESSFSMLKEKFQILFEEIWHRIPSLSISSLPNILFRKLSEKDLFPNKVNLGFMGEGDFFSVIELIFDLIKQHELAERRRLAASIWKISGVSVEEQVKNYWKNSVTRLYVDRVNAEVLRDLGYIMATTEGIIQNLPEEGMEKLVEREVDTEESVQKKIKHAQDLFFDRDADLNMKRSACEALGHVLEPVRKQIKETELGKDSEELFGIINNFKIRHNKKNTKKIENEILLDWVFYSLLNIAKTFLRLRKSDK